MKTPLLRLFVVLLFIGPLAAADWNQWRGPNRDGTIPAATWPDNFDQLTPLWRVDLAEGYSSPIIRENTVYTVETEEKTNEVVRAFDLQTGTQTWEQTWPGAMKVPFFASKNGSWARATPAVTMEGLYVGGIRDVLVKLRPEDGTEAWRIDFLEREGTELPAFGFVCSPLPADDAIYLQAGCAVTKLDAKTGETLWRAMENRQAMFGSAFSSPVIATIHGKQQLVAQTRSELGGIDLETGEVLWSTPVKAFRGMNILTPLVIGNRVFTATYGGGSMLFEVDAKDGTFSVKSAWVDESLEGYMASPVAIGDHLYLLNRDKHFRCLELATGKVAWKSEETFGEYWSMIVNQNRILALDQTGELLLIDASPDALNIVSRKSISKQPTWASVAISDDLVVVRELKGLAAFRWK